MTECCCERHERVSGSPVCPLCVVHGSDPETRRDPSTLKAMAERWENVPAYRATRPPSIAENLRHVAKQMEAATAMEEAGEP